MNGTKLYSTMETIYYLRALRTMCIFEEEDT